jgi:restriction system protein
MKQAGLVATTRRGWYQITPLGHQVLADAPAQLDNEYLMRFEGFRAFRTRSKSQDDSTEDESSPASVATSAHPVVPPDEALERAYARLRSAIEAELLDTLGGVTPGFFEQLVIDLLVRMGYGGSRAEAARAIGRSGDGGIDGVIDEDRLGLDVIYVQAKRWEASVGRPEIQKFAGALQGQRARKGIFITTSTFTREAEDYAQRIDSRIVLIDGQRLAALMFEYEVGVTARGSYTVKSIDGDYFEES